MARRGIAWSQLRIGLFVTLTVTAAAVAVFFIDEFRYAIEKRYPLHFYTSTTQSLRIRTPVWLAGQPVGVVDGLDFEPPRHQQEGRLRVDLAVRVDVLPLVTEGAAVEIITAGLLGETVVNIRPAPDPGPALTAGSEIPTAREIDPSQVTLRARTFYSQLGPTLERWSQVLDTARHGAGTVGRLTQNLAEVRLLRRHLREVSELFGDVSRSANSIRDFMSEDEIQSAIGRMAPRVEQLTTLWADQSGSVGRVASDSTLLHRLNGITEGLTRISQRLDTGRGTLGRFLNDRILVDELRRTRQLLRELRAQYSLGAGERRP